MAYDWSENVGEDVSDAAFSIETPVGVDESLGAGRHAAVWDGASDGGRPVASGVYVCRLTAEGSATECKSVLLR